MLDQYEKQLRDKGYSLIAGIDEAGRGPLAGPVVAAAVILGEWSNDQIKDSKKLSPKKREHLYELITENAVAYSVGVVPENEIDTINIYQATLKAMYTACDTLQVTPQFLLIDAMRLDTDIPILSIVDGDNLSYSIAAASIVAKVTRDRMMLEYHESYPMYGFDKHKGYGTAHHMKMIREHGPCPIHRRSFAPIRDYYARS